MAILNWPRKSVSTQPSEPQLWELFNSLNDVVVAFDQDQRILTINQSWEKITGIPVADTLDQPLSDFMHPEDKPGWSQLLKTISTAKTELIWFRLLHKSGEIRWCEMRVQAMKADALYPLCATLCDITPQVRSEQVREASHRSLQSLVNRLPAMLYRSRNNVSWTMEYVSSGCELLTGYPAETLLNQSQICLGSMIHADDAGYVWEDVQTALQMQQCFDLNYRLTRKNGTQIRVRDKGRGLYSDSGMVLGVEGIILPTD